MAKFDTPRHLAVNGSGSDPMLDHAHRIIEAANQLTPLSHSAAQLISLNSTQDASTTQVVSVISTDQVLAAALLREANSAASAAANSISTIDSAVVRLGMSRVMSSALRLSLSKQMTSQVPEYGMSDGQLGLLSVVGSIAAELVREQAKVKLRPEIVTAALLRDIGVLVLARFLDAPHRLMLDVVREAGTSLAEGERMVLDANHGEAGGLLCQHWRLPEPVRLGVQYHHDPFACDDPIAHGVYVADAIAHQVAVRTGGGWSHSVVDEQQLAASAELIAFDLGHLDAIVDLTISRFESRDTGLSLTA